MAIFKVELGYDYNAHSSAAWGGYLMWGVTDASGTPSLTRLRAGDEVEFLIRDVSTRINSQIQETSTPSLIPPQGYSYPQNVQFPNSATAWFTCAPGATTTTFPAPVGGAALTDLQNGSVTSLGQQPSPIFGSGPFPTWQVLDSTGNDTFRIGNAGSYYFLMQIFVSGTVGEADPVPWGPRTFGVDPEMIVDP